MATLRHGQRPGPVLRAGAFVLTLAFAVPAPPAHAVTRAVEVTLEEDARGHLLVGSFTAPVRPEVAWAVLTDYDGLPTFVSSLKESRATRGESGVLRVQQRGIGRAGFFKREMNVVLEISEHPPWRIAFRDVSGQSFSSYDGSWSLGPDDAGTVVRYELRATPKGALPGAISRRLARSNVTGLLDEVRREMVRRGAARAQVAHRP